MPLRTNLPRVEIYVLVASDSRTVTRTFDEHLLHTDFSQVFSGPSSLTRVATRVAIKRSGLISLKPTQFLKLDPYHVDLLSVLSGPTLDETMRASRQTVPLTLETLTKVCPRSLVLRGFFPEFLRSRAEAETARAVRGQVTRPLLVVTESPIPEMAWPEVLFHDRLLNPGDLVKFTVEQIEENNCRRWHTLPAPDIFRMS